MCRAKSTREQNGLTPQEGKEQLKIYADEWSAAVGSLGIQATYAIIAANWAVHSSAGKLLGNTYATISVGLCIGFLLITLLLTETITEWLRNRWQKAEDSPEWWNAEWEERAASRWPFTERIECLARWLRYFKACSPVVAGLFFILSLFSS